MRTFHLAFASFGRHPPFAGQVDLRAAIRSIARVASSHLLLFGIAGEHTHIVLRCDRRGAGLLARSLLKSLRAVARDALLEPARLQPVDDQDQLWWLHDYLLQLPARTGVGVHPALWEGSPLADLLGARWLPGFEVDPTAFLPGWEPARACAVVGLAQHPAPPTLAQVRLLGMGRIAAAAAAATAAHPSSSGRTATEVMARRAAARLAQRAGLPRSELSWAFGQTRRTAYRLAGAPLPAAVLGAVRMRLALEQAVAAQPATITFSTAS